MLLTMLFDDEDETAVTALFQVGQFVVQIRQKPHEGRVYNKDLEDKQEHVSTVHRGTSSPAQY